MAIAPGTRLGPYEVTAQIGVGGMGEVYRATDTNLKRAVAIKVLPESVAGDGERLARFQREAEVLASLNHPNIAAIYGLERSERTTALVMELVEGPTLAERIAGGPGGPGGLGGPKGPPLRTDAPRAEGPRAEGPRAEGPRAEGPRAEGPRTEGPRTEGPRTEGPRTEGPRTEGRRGGASAPPIPDYFAMAPLVGGNRVWDLAPDGRFVIIRSSQADAGGSAPANLILVQHWFEELKRLVPTN